MSEVYNAGYYLQYLWEQRERLCEQAGFDLKGTLKTLSCFELARYQSPNKSVAAEPTSEVVQHIVAVYTNLLQRGLPTLAPVWVERMLIQEHSSAQLPLCEASDNATIRFEHKDSMIQATELAWLRTLARTHLVIDPRLVPASRRDDSFDSEEELSFYSDILPQSLGPDTVV